VLIAEDEAKAKPKLWREGQRFDDSEKDILWWVSDDKVWYSSRCGNTPAPSTLYPTIFAFEAAIASGELKPVEEQPAPTVVPWSKLEQVPLDHWYQMHDRSDTWTRLRGIRREGDRIFINFGDGWHPLDFACGHIFHAPTPFDAPLPCGQVQP
jgi:hypothetical protein